MLLLDRELRAGLPEPWDLAICRFARLDLLQIGGVAERQIPSLPARLHSGDVGRVPQSVATSR